MCVRALRSLAEASDRCAAAMDSNGRHWRATARKDEGGVDVNGAASWDELVIDRVLWSAEEIEARVDELASSISADFAGKSLAVVGVATGAFLFVADLVRKIKLPVAVDFVRMQSYGSKTTSSGVATCISDVRIDLCGKHVLLVEDIIDTGVTLSTLVAHFGTKDVASFSVCTLLDKPSRRLVPLELAPGAKFYCGFVVGDEFVVGYGMDYAEKYRSLPYVGVLKPHVYGLGELGASPTGKTETGEP